MPDALVLATNARIGADAFDWLVGTRSNRAFATIVWDGTFLDHAEVILRQRKNSHRRRSLIETIHSEIYHRITEHRRIRVSGIYDSRMDEGYTPFEPPQPRFFVNREDEVARLESFESYRCATVVAPPGFGKSMLVSKVLHTARRQGYSVVPVSFGSLLRDLGPFVLRLAKCLAVDHHDERLLNHVRRYGWNDAEEIAFEAGTAIAGSRTLVAVDNVNASESISTAPLVFLRALATHSVMSRVLFTSRVPLPSLSLAADLSIELGGFNGNAIDALFAQRRGQSAPAALKRYLVRERGGWPLLATLASSAAGSVKATQVLTERVEREAIHSITHELSSGAKQLLGVLASLQLDIGADELRSVLGTSASELVTAWSEVELAGLARRDALMTEAIHIDLRPPIREIIGKPASIDHGLARWFATFVDNVDRVSVAIDHYLLAEAYEEAAELLRNRGELLIRTGHADAALEFASRIPSEKLTGALHVSIVMITARALSGLGRAPEALTTLRTWSFETTYAPDAVPAYRLEIARQLYLVGEFDDCDHEALAVIGMPDATSRTIGSAWSLIGRVLFARRELDQAQSAYQRARDIFDAVGDAFGANKVRYRMGLIELKRGNLNGAHEVMTRVLVESRRLQDRKRESYALHRLGLISARRGDVAGAEQLFYESIALKRGAGNVRGVVFTQHELASLALRQGDVDVAWDFGQKAFRKAEECGFRKEAAMTATLLAIIGVRRGRTSEAERWLAIAVETFDRIGLPQRSHEAQQRYDAAILDAPAQ